MARAFAKSFYNSVAWKKLRETFIQKNFGICQRCGKSGAKQVHHKIYLTPQNIDDPSIALDEKNLELLCDNCHQLEHNEKYGVVNIDLMFDEYGNLVKKPPLPNT